MSYPANFTEGKVDDATFRKAIDLASSGKSIISVRQALKLAGNPEDTIEKYCEPIYEAGQKIHRKSKRPQMVLACGVILLGLLITAITALTAGRIYYVTLIISAIGVGWLVRLR